MPHVSFIASLALTAVILSACQATTSPSLEAEVTTGNVPTLTGPQIEQVLRGNTLHRRGRTAGREWQWAGHFRPDGTMSGRAWWNEGQRVAQGEWSVEGDNF